MFRYSPPSVGFAQLSSDALAMDDRNGLVPSATIGSVAATVIATGIPTAMSSAIGMTRPHLLVGEMAVMIFLASLFLSYASL